MNRLFLFCRDAQIYIQTRRWAARQGFKLGLRRTRGGRTFYPVFWRHWRLGADTAEVEDLADLPHLIHDLRESRRALQPGKFYICWRVEQQHREEEEETSSRSHTPWIGVFVDEGESPHQNWPSDPFEGWGYDPTPYASPKDAVDTIAFLPLEVGVRLQFCACVRYITGKTEYIPTPAYNREEIEEAILEVVRDRVYERVDRCRDAVEYVQRRLPNNGLPWEQRKQIVEQMIAEGRLVYEWQYEGGWWKRWLKRRQNRGRVCLAEPGWKRQWVSCENCGGTGKCPACQGSGWNPHKDPRGNLWYCWRCRHSGRYVRDNPKRSRSSDGICRHCEGDGKAGGSWQQIGATAQTPQAGSTTQHP